MKHVYNTSLVNNVVFAERVGDLYDDATTCKRTNTRLFQSNELMLHMHSIHYYNGWIRSFMEEFKRGGKCGKKLKESPFDVECYLFKGEIC